MALAALVIAAFPAPVAHAYERNTVEGDPSTPLAWWPRELSIHVAYDTSEDLTAAEVRGAVTRSLATWTRAGGCTDIQLTQHEATTLRTNLMGGMHDGDNVVVFREDAWPEAAGALTLAITTIVYRPSSGEIVDADIDLNGVGYTWSVSDPPGSDANDLENSTTHELGHLLGFAHVPELDATMYEYSESGDVAKRDLAPDDVRAVCDVYPYGARTPGLGGNRPRLTSGCTTMHAQETTPPIAWLGGGVLAIAILGRRPRTRR